MRCLYCLIACLLVTGCSWEARARQERNEQASPPSPEPSFVASDSEAGTVEPITLVIVQNKVEVADVFKRMAEVYHEEHPGVLVQVETYGAGEDFATRLTTMLRAANPPDLFTNEGLEEATKFIASIAGTEEGHRYMVEGAGMVPAFKSVTLKPANPLSISIMDWSAAGKTYAWQQYKMPDGFGQNVLGPIYEQLAARRIDVPKFVELVTTVISEIE